MLDLPWKAKNLAWNDHITFHMIKKNPNIRWGWRELSQRIKPIIPIEFIIKNNYDWDVNSICRNYPINEIEILAAKKKGFRLDWSVISLRKDLPLRFIRENKNKIHWNSLSKFHPIQEIFDNPDLPWVWKNVIDQIKTVHHMQIFNQISGMTIAPRELTLSICLEDILNNPDLDWNWTEITMFKNIKLWHIVNYPNLPWDLEVFCDLETDMDEIMKIDKPWKWENFSPNPTISKYLDKLQEFLRWENVSAYAILTPELITKYWDKIKWPYLSYNLSVPAQFFIDNLHLSWDYAVLSRRKDMIPFMHLNLSWEYSTISRTVPWEVVKAQPHRPWNIQILSSRSDLTIDIIKEFKLEWDWEMISWKFGPASFWERLFLPADWHPALLLKSVRETNSDIQFAKILRRLPREIQEKICAAVYGQQKISLATLKEVYKFFKTSIDNISILKRILFFAFRCSIQSQFLDQRLDPIGHV